MKLNNLLFKQVDNSALIVFRICFGLLLFLESIGAIFTGWVSRTLVEPKFTFSFMGLEWLQPLPGNGMYFYFTLMGLFGFMVMIGYKYRLNMIGFAIMWSGAYFMQKASYNNHYYLLMILSYVMIFLPANRYASIDAKRNPQLVSHKMSRWVGWIIMFQMGVVYTYAAIAKMYPDWLDTTFIELLLKSKKTYPLLGEGLFQAKGFHYFIAYSGLIFDLLVVPLLMYKPTRKYAFFASIFFHIFNSVVFHVGIFPYLSLAICLFFFEPKTIRNIFLKKKPLYTQNEVIVPQNQKWILPLLGLYVAYQLVMPLRHWVIQDNVLWTEEGHRLSWRMMLRSKSGYAVYRIEDKATQQVHTVKLNDHLTRKQKHLATSKPDVIWQFAQYLKRFYAEQGKDVAVYVDCKISVNGRPYQKLIDPKVDLTTVPYNTFKHCEWILPSNLD